jgi:histidyl-tRNA synthetase
MSGTNLEQLKQLEVLMAGSSTGLEGIDELRFICNAVDQVGLQQATLGIDLTLARGLNYYTGAIFEVAPPEGVKIGSIGGGGRYDDLTGVFGLNDVSGVGVSFGLDRIYLVMEELGLFPEQTEQSLKALFINFGEKEALYATQAISRLRAAGVVCELYPDAAKMKKQMSYADKRNVPYVILCGTSEMAESQFTLKQMATGEQEQLDIDRLLSRLSDS